MFANGVLVGSGVVQSDDTDGTPGDGIGIWEVTVEPLVDGVYDITTIVEDLAGNLSDFSGPLEITIDGTDPQRPTMDLLAVDDTGMSDRDNVTFRANDVPFTVTSEAGSDVVIKDGNTVIASFVSAGTDVVSLTLAEGTYLLSVEATDAAGNVSAQSEELVVTIDRTAPAASAPELAATSDTGTAGDNITGLRQPAFVGIAEANAKIHVFADGVLVGTGFVQSDETDGVPGDGQGIWEITVEPLNDGDHEITTIVEDLAGNLSDLGGPLTITVDSAAPQRPTMDLLAVDDTGSSNLRQRDLHGERCSVHRHGGRRYRGGDQGWQYRHRHVDFHGQRCSSC